MNRYRLPSQSALVSANRLKTPPLERAGLAIENLSESAYDVAADRRRIDTRGRVVPWVCDGVGHGLPVSVARVLVLAGLRGVRAQSRDTAGEWRFYSADAGSTKYSPLDLIRKENVTTLQVAWRHPAVDPRVEAIGPRTHLVELLPRDAAHGRRASVRAERPRVRRSAGSGNRQCGLDPETAGARPRGAGRRRRSPAASRTGGTATTSAS